MTLRRTHRLSIVTVLIILGIKCRGENVIEQEKSKVIDNNNIVQSCCDRKPRTSHVNVLSFHHNSRRSLVKNGNHIAAHDKSINPNVNRMLAHDITHKSKKKSHGQSRMHQRRMKKLKTIRRPNKSFRRCVEPKSIIQHTYAHANLQQRRLQPDGGRARIEQHLDGEPSAVRRVIRLDREQKSHSFDIGLKYLRFQRKNDLNCIMDRSRISSSIRSPLPLMDAIFL